MRQSGRENQDLDKQLRVYFEAVSQDKAYLGEFLYISHNYSVKPCLMIHAINRTGAFDIHLYFVPCICIWEAGNN